jgi:hypothetical protein
MFITTLSMADLEAVVVRLHHRNLMVEICHQDPSVMVLAEVMGEVRHSSALRMVAHTTEIIMDITGIMVMGLGLHRGVLLGITPTVQAGDVLERAPSGITSCQEVSLFPACHLLLLPAD